jgi:hypothetical protein
MVGIGVKTMWMTICQNCTSIVIETSPTNTAISGRSNKYWYAAPYPSSYHWWKGIKVGCAYNIILAYMHLNFFR